MKVVAIIPARMGSSRFPGKPLAEINGVSMVAHCYFRTAMAKSVDKTYVATCDQEIFDHVTAVGGDAVITSSSHDRASDRTAEALENIQASTGETYDLVVMVQGDEPMITPEMVDQAVAAMDAAPNVGVGCLMAPVETLEEFEDPNEVKVVVSNDNRALYFSREPIPTPRRDAGGRWLKQVCIIPFRRDYLERFNALESTPLEIVESIDLNRCLEHGDPVLMVLSSECTFSVDTEDDRLRVEVVMKNDALSDTYRDQYRRGVSRVDESLD
jgi:3-deoxy-manno-octulosonate cytidylyltransferase (CMP-KDO synthetase)